MKSKKEKKFLKIIILIVFIIALIFVSYIIYEKIQESRFKKMLESNDATNYELTEIVNRQRNKGICKR